MQRDKKSQGSKVKQHRGLPFIVLLCEVGRSHVLAPDNILLTAKLMYNIHMKVLITGGHITPALAVAAELKEKGDANIVFVGRKYTYENDQAASFEYQEVKKAGYEFVDLKAGRLSRLLNMQSIVNILQIPFGFLGAFGILRREKPDAILSFGGYIALPISIVGSVLKIPVFTHEQTIAPGWANIIIAFFAQKVFVSFPQSARFFSKNKTIVSGNPIRKEVFLKKNTVDKILDVALFLQNDKPTILIMGGSLGSHSINIHIEKIARKLCEKYNVIHQTGNVEEFGDYERLKRLEIKYYFVKDHISGDVYGSYLSAADIIISRAGANTLFELIALKKPSVLIPLPWSAGGEQQKQAELLVENGVAELFNQEDDDDKLLLLIEKVVVNKEKHAHNFSRLASLIKQDAAQIIADSIYEMA